MDLTIRLDNLIQAQRVPQTHRVTEYPSASQESEPMQIGYTHLPPEEKERRFRNHLCLYCGQSSHMRATCPTQPISRDSAAVSSHLSSSKSFELAVTLRFGNEIVNTTALIDSGAAGNFIDLSFAETHHLSLLPCKPRMADALWGQERSYTSLKKSPYVQALFTLNSFNSSPLNPHNTPSFSV